MRCAPGQHGRSVGSACGGPATGPEFDADFEGPSEADIQRFGSDEFDPAELDYDFGTPPRTAKSPAKAVLIVTGGVAAVGVVIALVG